MAAYQQQQEDLEQQALCALDCDAQHFVATAASWMASMAPPVPSRIPIFIHTYAFHHSLPSEGEVAAAAQGEQCRGMSRLPCGALVEAEAAVGTKRLAEYFVGLLSGGMATEAAERLLQQTALFGWVPCHAFVRRNMNASLFWQGGSKHEGKKHKRSGSSGSSSSSRRQGPRIEAGGGSGAGFQVWCDNTLLVSAGGGGGGGVEGRLVPGGEGSSFSVGGGGGGGAQFRVPLGIIEQAAAAAAAAANDAGRRRKGKHAGHHHKVQGESPPAPASSRPISLDQLGNWTSVGGGGGCGTTDFVENTQDEVFSYSAPTTGGTIMCGQELDADACQDQRQTGQLAEALQWCVREGHALRMTGGGGGGGGTGECCAPFQLGYGFSFEVLIRGPVPGPPSPLPATAVDKKGEKGGKHGGGGNLSSTSSTSSTSNKNSRKKGHHHGHGRSLTKDDDEDAAITAQLRYDPLFHYLYSASKTCPTGFQDWCCVCSGAKALLAQETQVDARLAWFADATCCTGTEQSHKSKAPTTNKKKGKGRNSVAAPGQSTLPWRPEDDLPFFPPPSWPVGGKGAAGCELQLDETGRRLVVQAKVEKEEALLWRFGSADEATPAAATAANVWGGGGSKVEKLTVGLWGSLCILSALIFVLGGVLLTRQRRQQRGRYSSTRRADGEREEEEEGGHLMREEHQSHYGATTT